MSAIADFPRSSYTKTWAVQEKAWMSYCRLWPTSRGADLKQMILNRHFRLWKRLGSTLSAIAEFSRIFFIDFGTRHLGNRCPYDRGTSDRPLPIFRDLYFLKKKKMFFKKTYIDASDIFTSHGDRQAYDSFGWTAVFLAPSWH